MTPPKTLGRSLAECFGRGHPPSPAFSCSEGKEEAEGWRVAVLSSVAEVEVEVAPSQTEVVAVGQMRMAARVTIPQPGHRRPKADRQRRRR